MKDKLDIFTGSASDPFDVYQWLRHVELAAMCHEWPEGKQLATALMNLRGPALCWLDSLDMTREYTWEFFKTSLISRFGEKPQQIIDKIYSRCQQAIEDVGSYTDDFVFLLSRAAQSGNHIPVPMQLTVYIEGLLPYLQDAVIVKEPQTMEEAIKAAKYLEFHKARNVTKKGNKNANSHMFQVNGNTHGFFNERPPPRHSYLPHPQHHYQQPGPPRHPNPRRDHDYRNNNQSRPNHSGRPNQINNNNADVAALTKQIGDLQIKLSQLDSTADFNTFNFDHDDYQEDDLDAYNSVNNHGSTWPAHYDQSHFDQYADIEMRDAPAYPEHRPKQRRGFDPRSNSNQSATTGHAHANRRPQNVRGFQLNNQPQPNSVPQGRPQSRDRPSQSARNHPAPPNVRRGPSNPTHTSNDRPAHDANVRNSQPSARNDRVIEMPPIQRRVATRSKQDMIGQIESMPYKLSLGELIRVAPSVRKKLSDRLNSIEQETRESYNQANFCDAALPDIDDICSLRSQDSGCLLNTEDIDPQQTTFNKDHAKPSATTGVLKAMVRIAKNHVSAIVDSGASHCMISAILIDAIIQHYLMHIDECQLTLVVPNLTWAPWYPKIFQYFQVIGFYQTGSQILQVSPSQTLWQHHPTPATQWQTLICRGKASQELDSELGNESWAWPYICHDSTLDEELSNPQVGHIQLGNKDSDYLHNDQKDILNQAITEYNDVIAWSEDCVGRTNLQALPIDTGDTLPIKQRPYRHSKAEDEIIEAEVLKWLRQDIIEQSHSPWSSPVVLVPKKAINPNDPLEPKRHRLCIDFRRLNDVTKTDSFPLPIMQDALDGLGKSKVFSIIDLRSAFLQLPLKPEDKEKTAFTTKSGLYQFTTLPFGLKNSPSIFQRLMHNVLNGLLHKTCMVYLDDIIVFSESFELHMQDIKQVFDRLRQFNLKIHPEKTVLATDCVIYLGHKCSAEGILPDPTKLHAVANLQPPQTVTDVRSFLGLVGYYRRFIKDFALIAEPLHILLHKNEPWYWESPQQQAFENLKDTLLTAPILTRPDFDRPFILQTDWSGTAIGAILAQQDELGNEHVVAYWSRALQAAEKNYSATEGEALAAVKSVIHFRPYLHGHRFQLAKTA